ncbi:hypothetical protein WJX82_008069 [Trebouxia sp. C0006]
MFCLPQAQRAIGCFVVANCVAFGILIIAMAITVCIQDPEKGCHRMLGDDSNKQLFLLVIFSMQAALTIGAIRDHNKVLQVLNQDTEANSTACPAEDDNCLNIYSEEEH